MVGKRVPLPSLSGVTRRVHAASVRRLGMLLPCGLPEGKASVPPALGDDFIAGVRLCHCNRRLRQS